MVRDDYTIEIVEGTGAWADAVEDFVYEVLYRDFGVDPQGHWRQDSGHQTHAIAVHAGAIVGAARTLGMPGESRRQLRQVAVDEAHRRGGLGRALVEALESHARSQGAREIWLNARSDAFAFYERLGYRYTGPTFVSELTRIPHRPMSKPL